MKIKNLKIGQTKTIAADEFQDVHVKLNTAYEKLKTLPALDAQQVTFVTDLCTLLANQAKELGSKAEPADKMKKKLSKEEGEAQWGFDLTSITAANWKKVLLAGGIDQKPVNDDGKWIWTGPQIKIHTGNDPISGKYGRTGGRENEKDYASYIGVYGEKALVKKVAKMISTLADDIKEETPNKSRFI